MAEKPRVGPGDWITVGKDSGLDAVVSHVYKDPENADVEVVYLDRSGKAINEDVVWKEDHWAFKVPGPCGGYADGKTRLGSFVSKLRLGRYSRN